MKHYMKYYSKHPSNNNHYISFLIKCIVLLVACNIISCKCGRTETPTSIQDVPSNDSPTNPEEPTKPIDLTLAGVKTSVKGAEPIQLKVANDGTQSTVCGGLKLKATRIEGSYASIVSATDQGDGKYEIALGTVSAKGSIDQDLSVVPGADKKAIFKFQLIYEGKEVGSGVDITWEKGASIKLKEVKYNETTGYITYSLANNGSEAVSQVKLKYKSKTVDIQVGGKKLDIDQEITVDIPDLLVPAPGNEKENQNLVKLDFGTNPKAEFVFTIVYEGGTTKPEEVTLTPTEVKLDLKLAYDESKGQLTYHIKNTGENTAKNVTLIYNNVSTKVEEQTVLLGAQVNGETAFVELIAKTGETTNTLPFDFQTNDKARFEFKVTCNGIILKHLTKTEDFKAPQAELELIDSASGSRDTIRLEGVGKELKFKINQKPGGGIVDLKQLKLKIQQTETVGNTGFLSKSSTGPKVTEIAGQQLGNIGHEIILYVNPQQDEQLKFELKLFYKNQPMGKPLIVSWKAKEIKLQLSWIDPLPASQGLQVVQLAEDKESIKFKITQEATSGLVDASQLKLVIQQTVGSTGFLSKSSTGPKVTEIAGRQLDNLGDEIILYVNPQQDEQLKFELKLFYKNQPMSKPLIVSWKAKEVKLQPSWADPIPASGGLLAEDTKSYKENKIGEPSSLNDVINPQAEAEKLKGKAETLTNKIKTTIPDVPLANTRESLIREDMQVPTQNVIEKRDEFMQSAQDEVKGLLDEGKLEEASKKFENAVEVYANLLTTPGNKQAIEDIYKQIIQKLEAESQVFSSNTDKSNSSSKAIKLAEIAVKLSEGTWPFIESTKLKAIAKKLYTAALDILLDILFTNFTEPVKDLMDADADAELMLELEDAKSLAKVAKEYELEASKIEKVNKAAYAALVNLNLAIAKNNLVQMATFPSDSVTNIYAKSSFMSANAAAAAAREAQKNGFESLENNQAVQVAYTAAADAYQKIADNNKEEAARTHLTRVPEDANKAYEAAKNAAKVAQTAEANGFENAGTKQATKAAYTAAVGSFLIMAKRNKVEVFIKCYLLDSAVENAKKAYEAADKAYIVAQEAKSYGSTATNRAVKGAYTAALEAYQALNDKKYATIIQQIEAKIKSLP